MTCKLHIPYLLDLRTGDRVCACGAVRITPIDRALKGAR